MSPSSAPARHATSALLVVLGCALPSAALAHPGHAPPAPGPGAAALAGALHLLTGPDHLVVLFALGLVAARLGPGPGRALGALGALAAFSAAALCARLVGATPAAAIDWVIAASLVGVAALVIVAPRVELRTAIVVGSIMLVPHGWAHAAELGELPALAGVAVASALPWLAGLGVGSALARASSSGAADPAR